MGPGSRPGNRTRVPEPRAQKPSSLPDGGVTLGVSGLRGTMVAEQRPVWGAGGVTLAEAAELRRWLESGANAVKRARGRLDAINVFPVADADTGTNMYLTLREGNRAVSDLPDDATHKEVVAAFARGALAWCARQLWRDRERVPERFLVVSGRARRPVCHVRGGHLRGSRRRRDRRVLRGWSPGRGHHPHRRQSRGRGRQGRRGTGRRA